MDTLRGPFDTNDLYDDTVDFDAVEDDGSNDLPPSPIGQDERRMQVRAYNHWAKQLGDRNFPYIEELEPQNLDDFGPFSVLLDFSRGIDDPAIQFLGSELATECGAEGPIEKLSDVPSRSLLSRITDHYMQILANQAPIGFEAEFINQAGITILYRGILLPYSSDDETIDFIYGVINWKEMADQLTADELLLEIDHALENGQTAETARGEKPDADEADAPLELAEGWADGPIDGEEGLEDSEVSDESEDGLAQDTVDLGLPTPDFGHFALGDEDEEEDEEEANYSFASLTDHVAPPKPKPEAIDLDGIEAADLPEDWNEEDWSLEFAETDPLELGLDSELPVSELDQEPLDMAEFAAEESEDEPVADAQPDTPVELETDAFEKTIEDAEFEEFEDVLELAETVDAIDLSQPLLTAGSAEPGIDDADGEVEELLESALAPLDDDAGLHDCLASARELAETARTCEDRSRTALYAAVGRAYDVSLAAEEAPEDYAELIAENGLTIQDRAPMTPIVKLVFGADYDKTRLTEYAAVLSHAHRVGIERGSLAGFLSDVDGGLKGVVNEERRLRKEETGKVVEPKDAVRSALAKKLRKLEALDFDALAGDGPEFGLVMIRRTEEGEIAMLGEIEQDIPLVERAARKLLG